MLKIYQVEKRSCSNLVLDESEILPKKQRHLQVDFQEYDDNSWLKKSQQPNAAEHIISKCDEKADTSPRDHESSKSGISEHSENRNFHNEQLKEILNEMKRKRTNLRNKNDSIFIKYTNRDLSLSNSMASNISYDEIEVFIIPEGCKHFENECIKKDLVEINNFVLQHLQRLK